MGRQIGRMQYFKRMIETVRTTPIDTSPRGEGFFDSIPSKERFFEVAELAHCFVFQDPSTHEVHAANSEIDALDLLSISACSI